MPKKKEQPMAQEQFARVFLFVLLGLSVYWATLVGIFSIFELLEQLAFVNLVFIGILLMLPVIAWLNLFYYINLLRKEHILERWIAWSERRRDEILFAIALTFIFEILALLVAQGQIEFSIGFEALFSFLILPKALGDFVMRIVEAGTAMYIPALSFINELDVLVGIYFQLVFFYYISRFFFWAPHVHRKKHR